MDKSQFSKEQLDEYTRILKDLHTAEGQYNLTVDQLKGSLLAVAICLDLDYDAIAQDYQLLTDQQITESKSESLDTQLFEDLELAITISTDLDELNRNCLDFYQQCIDANVEPLKAIHLIGSEARHIMQKFWNYEWLPEDEEILNEMLNIKEMFEL